jgi:RNA polymerase sigma-70 factor (ECF subfamily)
MGVMLVDRLSEKELVLRARSGSATALEELVRRFYPSLKAYLSKMLGPHEADDALQDVFIKMAQHLDRYQDRDRFGGWLFRIAVNRARDLLRQRASRAPALPEPVGEPLLTHADDSDRIASAIQDLPPQLAEPLLLTYQEGLSQAQIADILGISVAAVKMRVYRAIRQLRALLKKEMP